MYTIVIQLGAILALLLLFLSRIVDFIRTFPKGETADRTWLNHPIVAHIHRLCVHVGSALLLHKWSEKNLGSLNVIAWALLIGGIAMWIIDAWSDRYEANTTHVEEMSLPQAIWIGLCRRWSAIFPGTSRLHVHHRSRAVGGDGPAVRARIQLPALDSTMIRRDGVGPEKRGFSQRRRRSPRGDDRRHWIVLAIGFGVSFVVALGVVEWFLHWVRKHGFTLFAIYRILLGSALLLWGTNISGVDRSAKPCAWRGSTARFLSPSFARNSLLRRG